MKHDCQETEPLISGYLDGELTQSDRQRVDLILEDCEQCSLACPKTAIKPCFRPVNPPCPGPFTYATGTWRL